MRDGRVGRVKTYPNDYANEVSCLSQSSICFADVAQCPACEGEVRKRRRKVGRDGHTYFYRHRLFNDNYKTLLGFLMLSQAFVGQSQAR